MCGIFGIVNDKTNKAAQTVLEGLKKLEYRGYDSWGISLLSDDGNEIAVEKHTGKISDAQTSLPEGSVALGHTRWATHGGVTDTNAHPHLDCSKQIAVIHNGIVENYQELKEDLKAKGHTFISETDTEVIAHLVEEELKSQSFTQAVLSTFKKLVGSNAIGVLDNKTQSIMTCRNGSPIVIGKGIDTYYMASDVTPLLAHTQEIYFVNDGEAVSLAPDGLHLYDIQSGSEKEMKTEIIDWKVEDAEKSGYPHFLLKEIMEQKVTIPKTAALNEDVIQDLAKRIQQGYKVVLAACGTASYCGLASQYFFAQAGIEAKSYGAYEFLPFAQFCNEKTIFIAISQSGETADTIVATKAAKAQGAHIVAVVNARGSTLERLANSVLAVGAGPEIAVVSTKAYTSQLSTLYLLSQAAKNNYQEGQQKIKELGLNLESWLTDELLSKVIDLAKQVMDEEDMYIIGKHFNYPAALEFSLKIKETSYIHSEAFASAELKHGVITLIQKNTPCFVLNSNDETKHEVLSSAAELKARGGTLIGIGPFTNDLFDHYIATPDAQELTIFYNVLVGQMLGYYLGIGRGADPDKPRNLAKSVTVK